MRRSVRFGFCLTPQGPDICLGFLDTHCIWKKKNTSQGETDKCLSGYLSGHGKWFSFKFRGGESYLWVLPLKKESKIRIHV